jgi:DNA polymerase III epsilon subunit-like protein
MTKIIIDSETTSLPEFPTVFGKYYPPDDLDKYKKGRLVELGWIILDEENNIVDKKSFLVKGIVPEDYKGFEIHKITNKDVESGEDIVFIIDILMKDLLNCHLLIGHNIDFDRHIIMSEMCRLKIDPMLLGKISSFCTMKHGKEITKILNKKKEGFKFPRLEELCDKLEIKINGGHRAMIDVMKTYECYKKITQ